MGGKYMNFDFGYFDSKEGLWYDANHCDYCPSHPGPMTIFSKTYQDFSAKSDLFDMTLYGVELTTLKPSEATTK